MKGIKKHGYIWVTLILFLGSLIGHWMFAWLGYVDEQIANGHQIVFKDYLFQVLRDTLENWQSEFLQLIWQVAGLAYLWSVGSPQSKEGDDRKEAKIDEILRMIDEEKAEDIIVRLEKKYPKK